MLDCEKPLESSVPTNVPEYTVSEISGALKRTVEDAFGNVRVRGEISGYRGPHSSGHAYFTLKDDRARLEAVVWKTTMSRLRFRPEEGMEVIARGKLTTFPGSSKYQIVIEALEPAGAGALMALLEERKRRLAAEGLFAEGRKQLLPYLPAVIGVITSPTGAVIRDILHRIKDRFALHVLVWPVRVQGDTCAGEVAAAIQGFDALASGGPAPRPDLLIVARGGGSLEDLWGFNDEALARAAAASDIPIISAVGHETDWTLLDLVADVRAPTPTAAAEMAVPVRAELEAALATLAARLRAGLARSLERRRQATRAAARALPSPDQLLALPRRRFDEAEARLDRGIGVSVERKGARLSKLRLTPATLRRRIEAARRASERDLSRAEAALRAIVRARRAEFARVATQLPKCALAVRRHKRQRLEALSARITIEPVARQQRRHFERLTALFRRADRAAGSRLEQLRSRLGQTDRLLSTLSHRSVLDRGFAIVLNAAGKVVKRAVDVSSGEELVLRFTDGDAGAVAGGSDVPKPARPQKVAERKAKPLAQGSLF